MTALIEEFDKIHPLSDACKTYLRHVLKERYVPPRHYLLKAGRICSRMYFIREGMIYGYRIINDREICTQLLKEGNRCYSPASFNHQVPSKESLQAIEDCTLYSLDYEEVKKVHRLFPEFVHILLAYSEIDLAEAEERLEAFTTLNEHGLYRWLIKNRADFVQRLPGKYIASYIGLSPSALSKLRSRNTPKNN